MELEPDYKENDISMLPRPISKGKEIFIGHD